ncbi:MAG: hypothetical protein Terrestrivirus4_43 [Terrestrivirus sp.]|uniref:Uncharacterized protein n=1 Tax=Terrestrivirus sp. TaxID=2487775 RepID=A0A3G4ZMB6_9VIRU|nr:MAG: hypothetical protein Terrestrivirus4_43 [Terrestrivirus sp.]
MEYKYPPIYKYIATFVIIFLFLQFYKQIPCDTFLLFTLLITLLFIALDYMMIYDSPPLLDMNMDPKKDDDNSSDIVSNINDENRYNYKKYDRKNYGTYIDTIIGRNNSNKMNNYRKRQSVDETAE